MNIWQSDFDQYKEKTAGQFRESVINTLAVVLSSPQFLFLIEKSRALNQSLSIRGTRIKAVLLSLELPAR